MHKTNLKFVHFVCVFKLSNIFVNFFFLNIYAQIPINEGPECSFVLKKSFKCSQLFSVLLFVDRWIIGKHTMFI